MPLNHRTAFLFVCLALTPLTRAESTIATFTVDVTIPVGHPCMGGGISPARRVIEPLELRGFVLTIDGQKPFVVAAFDWCEIRGSAYDNWRAELAEVAATEPARVLVTSTHVHDAPVMDPEAEFILRDAERSGAWKDLPAPKPAASIQVASVCWPDFNRICIQRAKLAISEALKTPHRVTHIGLGQAKVERVASNRRIVMSDGRPNYGRFSRMAGNPLYAHAPEGDIDPWLRSISFWDGDKAICVLHSYAVHPMSSYGAGEVSIDFVGLARQMRQKEQPDVFQIYASGCAGNVTAGKYNDGSPRARAELTERLHAAMVEAWKATEKKPLALKAFRMSQITLGSRGTPDHTEEALRHRLLTSASPFGRAEPAMGLAWYDRVKAGHKIDLPMIDFGPAQLLLLPAESYVEFQLFAEEQRKNSFVICMGYGECGPGYIPIERAWKENDMNLRDWTWVGPGSEEPMKAAIREVMTDR